jgi:hypothetical protein
MIRGKLKRSCFEELASKTSLIDLLQAMMSNQVVSSPLTLAWPDHGDRVINCAARLSNSS